MKFKASRNSDGTIHVTNVVMGRIGQHHVHTDAGLARWQKPGDVIEFMDGVSDCLCAEAVDKYPMVVGHP